MWNTAEIRLVERTNGTFPVVRVRAGAVPVVRLEDFKKIEKVVLVLLKFFPGFKVKLFSSEIK